MIKATDAPEPHVVSSRKLGLELEVDVGYNGEDDKIPDNISGWTAKGDCSLSKGTEFVFDRPVLAETAIERIKAFCSAMVDLNVHQKGGYHVHVQGHDYSLLDCWHLAMLYSKCRSAINQLVAKSRTNNHFCNAIPSGWLTSSDSFIRETRLGSQSASSRVTAKQWANRYYVVNFNMMACSCETQRSIEFRQGSISKRFGPIWGWAAFVLALTEAAKCHTDIEALPAMANLDDLKQVLANYEARSGSTNLVEWVTWRVAYLNPQITDDDRTAAIACLSQNALGLYGLSRAMDINLSATQVLLNDLKEKDLVRAVGNAYRPKVAKTVCYRDELESLIRAYPVEEPILANQATG